MYHVHPCSFQKPLTTSMINDRKNNWASKERDRGRKMTGKPERSWRPKDLYRDTQGIVQSSVCLFFIYLSLFLSLSPGIFLSLWPSGKVTHSQSRAQGAAKARGPWINTSFAGRDLLSFAVSNSSDVEKKRNRIWWKTTHMAFNFPDIWKVFRGHGPLQIQSCQDQDLSMLKAQIRCLWKVFFSFATSVLIRIAVQKISSAHELSLEYNSA